MKTAVVVIVGFVILLALLGAIVLGVSWLMAGKEADKARLDAMGIYMGENHD